MLGYTYNAIVDRWVDGDTVDLRVDLGFTVWVKQRFRLSNIDTPERGEALWHEARNRASELAPSGSTVVVQSHKTDKYGRYLGVIIANGESVNDKLLAEGLAKVYTGK